MGLISKEHSNSKNKIETLYPTYPSLVLFALVKEEAIPEGTLPIEMLVSNTENIDEAEVTAYILSIDDKTLCKEGHHVITVIGPSFKEWPLGFKNKYKSSPSYKNLSLIILNLSPKVNTELPFI